MAKTRSQTGNITIKKEEEEEKEDCKPSLLLNSVGNTRSNNKIAKRRPSIINNGSLSAQQVKVEQDTDTKSLLQSLSETSKLPKGQQVSQEQINQLLHYIVNGNMSVRKASRKVNISKDSAYSYYNIYKNDPEKKIPVPRSRCKHSQKYYTQEQVGNFIKYVNDDKMTLKEASAKADIHYGSGRHYYSRYLKDPNHNIPILSLKQRYTQDQKEAFIGYIVTDKMSILAASKKAKINRTSAQAYYHKYFNIQNPDIATPSHIATSKGYTQEQIKEVIGYIVDDKMSIAAASRKANLGARTCSKYYQQYLKNHNTKVPVKKICKQYTQDQKNELLRYIIDNKMTIKAASKKANVSGSTGYTHYRQYLKKHNLYIPHRKLIQEQMDKLVSYIVNEKMTISEASKKANMKHNTAYKYYQQYLKDNNLPLAIGTHYTRDQINQFIGYIVIDKMTIKAASEKVNMSFFSGRKYYRQYLMNQKCGVPTRRP